VRWFWAKSILLACASSAFAVEPPPLMLWAWEQSADLRFLDGRKDVGVAYLAATAFVRDEGVKVQYRGVPMLAPAGMFRMPVLRIEGRGIPGNRKALVDLCKRLIQDGGSGALQIDFDVSMKLRPLYEGLIQDLRRDFGTNLYLSMTVLAGWCDKPWFGKMPVNEHVVMLFRMGKAGKGLASRLEREKGFATPACRESLGYSTDERLAPRLDAKRRYWFSPKPWSPLLFASLSR
jgi:hypothetical protein